MTSNVVLASNESVDCWIADESVRFPPTTEIYNWRGLEGFRCLVCQITLVSDATHQPESDVSKLFHTQNFAYQNFVALWLFRAFLHGKVCHWFKIREQMLNQPICTMIAFTTFWWMCMLINKPIKVTHTLTIKESFYADNVARCRTHDEVHVIPLRPL